MKFILFCLLSYAHAAEISLHPQDISNVLRRSMTMQGMSDDAFLYPEQDFLEDLEMIKRLHPKYIGRAAGWWGMTWDTHTDEVHFLRAKRTAEEIHKINPDIIIEAAVFEYAHQNIGNMRIPDWVYSALGENIPSQSRNFIFKNIVYDDYASNTSHQWGEGDKSGAIDIKKAEAKRWFMYRAGNYIMNGFEALHLGQVKLMGELDLDHSHWWNLTQKIRVFAQSYARRGKVLLNGHTAGMKFGNLLVLDLHAAPLRPNGKRRCLFEDKKNMPAVIKVGHTDSIYQKSSGGITPAGHQVNANPYFVEFDNFGVSDHPGVYRKNDWSPWGYDEITWFALNPKKERTKIMKKFDAQIKKWDQWGSLMFAGRRGTTQKDIEWPGIVYRINGLEWNDEATLNLIWNN